MDFDFSLQPGLELSNKNANKTEAPLVSVITPYYNSGKYFMQTYNCVMNQTFPFFEWIIVDDGSTDADSVKLLEDIKDTDPRIRIYRKENGGASSAKNFAVGKSRSDLILPLDADDLIEATFIEYCYWMLLKNPDASWAYTDSLGFQGEEYLWERKFDPIAMKTENLLTQCALIKKTALDAVGGFSELERYYNEDWHLWLKILANGGYPVQACGEPLMWYRRSNTGALSHVSEDATLTQKNREFIKEAADKVVNPNNPIIYPRFGFTNWHRPVFSNFDKCVYSTKEKPHVAFLFPHLVTGGADKFNIDLIEGLQNRGYDLSVFTTNSSANNWLQKFRSITPNIYNLPNFLDPFNYAEFISYYIKSRQVDILFVSNSYVGYYLIPWLRAHFPKLVIVDYVHMEEWYWRQGGYSRISASMSNVTEKTYVCNSGSRDILIDHFHVEPDKVNTVHIGVDADYFDADKVKPGILRSEIGIDASRPVILFICRLHEQKRPFLMLDIAERVAKKDPSVAFAIVGDGPLENDLKYSVSERHLNNNVYFLGAKSDTRPYYKDANLSLICSIKEGLALTAYESCSMSTPVVSADVGGQRDLVDNTVGALLPCLQHEEDIQITTYSDDEINLYVDAIIDLLNDKGKYDAASKECRERILNGFRIKDMVEFFDAEFKFLMSDEEYAAKRLKAANELSGYPFMLEELITSAFQVEAIEDMLIIKPNTESLMQKCIRVLKNEGFSVFCKKARKKIHFKVSAILKRPV